MPLHKNRAWTVTRKDTIHALALTLRRNWTLCSGFSFGEPGKPGEILALNDAFSADSAQEYAILVRGEDGGLRNVESLTCSWMESAEIEATLTNIAAGTYPNAPAAEGPLVVAHSGAVLAAALGGSTSSWMADCMATNPVTLVPHRAGTCHLCA